MTAEEYWHSDGIRLLNEDGTLPTVEERVKHGYRAGWDRGWRHGMVTARNLDRDEIEHELFGHAMTKAARMIREHNRRTAKPTQATR